MRWSDISFADRTIRQFAALWIVFFGALGLWQWFGAGNTPLGLILVILAITFGPAGLIWPGVLRPIYTLWMILVFPLGWVISHLILAVLFFGMFTPIALVFRLLGRDALTRKSQPEKESYWIERETITDAKRYLRQF